MRNGMLFGVLMGLLLLVSGCATIPQDSVQLSQEIGKGVKGQYLSQVQLVNHYFSQRRVQLNATLEKSIEAYFKTIIGQKEEVTLERNQLQDVSTDIRRRIEIHEKSLEELDSSRVFLLAKLEENYVEISKANSAITGLLQSSIAVENAKADAYAKIYTATDGKIDIAGALKEADEVIAEHGGQTDIALELLIKIKEFIEKNKEGGENNE